MADVAKVFMSGRSQAVRLPKAYRFDCKEVEVSREGDAVVLRPRKAEPWANLKAALEGFDETDFADWFPERREQPAEQERPGLDEIFRD
jgi:antitoxin VapB